MFRKALSKKALLDQDTKTDMTPMLDIVFIMLIFFVATTTFLNTQGIDITKPNNSDCKVSDCVPPLTTIIIDSGDNFFIDDRLIEIDSLQANVESKLGENPKMAFVVKIHDQATSNALIRAIDQIESTGAFKPTVTRWQ